MRYIFASNKSQQTQGPRLPQRKGKNTGNLNKHTSSTYSRCHNMVRPNCLQPFWAAGGQLYICLERGPEMRHVLPPSQCPPPPRATRLTSHHLGLPMHDSLGPNLEPWATPSPQRPSKRSRRPWPCPQRHRRARRCLARCGGDPGA